MGKKSVDFEGLDIVKNLRAAHETVSDAASEDAELMEIINRSIVLTEKFARLSAGEPMSDSEVLAMYDENVALITDMRNLTGEE